MYKGSLGKRKDAYKKWSVYLKGFDAESILGNFDKQTDRLIDNMLNCACLRRRMITERACSNMF